ncbi:hypothetical protein [Paracidovorax valerianellae]|uniref:Uncharacterized protein n=1 Tax=Paracidovorax valerianellae TaxID=187868 RepID=A0A1G6JVF1_9BURK|nr:hypothetical protein [Paracidovorax valerianellae]MDA8445254.1 hypothetical protein [Paracidovorax valerianellae]SDC22749.1 hypothetical protein SAMN05192589_101493 [Paracidovorax valerianellae]
MPTYQDKTNTAAIDSQIDAELKAPEPAKEVVQLVHNLCWETDITPDPMSQWLGLFATHRVRAQKWKTSADLIELYPSGTTGIGKSDRLMFQVGKTEVAVIKAYESDH